MSKTFDEALRDHLAGLGLLDDNALAPTWYWGIMQDQKDGPDFAVAVIPEAGLSPTNVVGERPGITIRVRHPLGDQAQKFMRKVFKTLQEFSSPNLAGSGVGVARIFASQGPVQLGRDDGPGLGRWIVQQTFQAIVATY